MKKSAIFSCFVFFVIFFLILSNCMAERDGGYDVTSSLWARAVLQVPGNPVTLVWQEVGTDITPSGDQVISGYFYADPEDFAYGSRYNPEVFVKIYIATNGWCNFAFNHVTVDDVSLYSAHNYAGTPNQTGSVTLNSRLDQHQYDGVNIDTSKSGAYSYDSEFMLPPCVLLNIPQDTLNSILFMPLSNAKSLQDGGYDITSSLWARAVLQVPRNPVTLVWQEVGTDITPSGDQVISGYFYADPGDFAYGSRYNPEVFVKIYIATNGWCNFAFNHVTVDNVALYSAHNYAGAPNQTGSVTLNSRLDQHQYDGVSIDTSTSGIIDSQGGEITVPEDDPSIPGVSLDVPKDALDSATNLTIKAEPPETPSSLSPRERAIEEPSLYLELVDYALDNLETGMIHPMYGPLFVLSSAEFTGPGIKFGPDDLQFNKAVTVTVPLDVISISSSNTTAMPLLYSNDGTWQVPEDFGFDFTSDKSTVKIPHFSILKYIKNFVVLTWNIQDVVVGVVNAQSVLPQDTFMKAVIEVVCSGTELQATVGDVMDEITLLEELFVGSSPGATPSDTNKLKNWILDQEGKICDNSITFAQLFSKALEQQNGNIYKALATAHGLLSVDRHSPYLGKLVENFRGDVTNDQSGARYHFFGAALHAFVHEYNKRWYSVPYIYDVLDPEYIITIEEGIASGDILSDTVEYAVDLKGAEFGRNLCRQIQGKTRAEIISYFNLDPSVVCVKTIAWMNDENVKMNWNAAKQYCAGKGGRLPTSLELHQAWVDGGKQTLPDHTPGFLNWLYWASGTSGGTIADTFLFSYGMYSGKDIDSEAYVRCVDCQ